MLGLKVKVRQKHRLQIRIYQLITKDRVILLSQDVEFFECSPSFIRLQRSERQLHCVISSFTVSFLPLDRLKSTWTRFNCDAFSQQQ